MPACAAPGKHGKRDQAHSCAGEKGCRRRRKTAIPHRLAAPPSVATSCRALELFHPLSRASARITRSCLDGKACSGVAVSSLTVQRFLPNLRLICQMGTPAMRLKLAAVLLAMIFLGAQFHFCADHQPGPSASHICPICAPGAWALPAPAIAAPTAGPAARLEVTPPRTVTLASIPLAISPRAPPQS